MAGLRTCTLCSQHLLPDMFSKLSARCKPCAASVSRQWRLDNPERAKENNAIFKNAYSASKKNGYRLKYRYGITLDQHAAMIDKQKGKCAICGDAFAGTPHVDHCHATGKIRGMLCDRCNRGIGYFRDDANRLSAAAKYLKGVA